MPKGVSLFSILLEFYKQNSISSNKKTPAENFFTEIVVHLFNTFPEILYAWLKSINLIDDEAEYIYPPTISSQVSYGENRPDIRIELLGNNYRDVIFVESKIGDTEHRYQLQRYAKTLYNMQSVRKKVLLYVTRDPDGKVKEEVVLEGIPPLAVQFKPERWHTLHQILQKQPKNTLVDEIIKFMHDKKMGNDKNLSCSLTS